jgi:hypothetical protein
MCFGLFLLETVPLVSGPYTILAPRNDVLFSKSNDARREGISC